MKPRYFLVFALSVLLLVNGQILAQKKNVNDDRFVSYIVDAKKHNISFFWKDDQSNYFRSIGALQNWLAKRNRKLIFAMNGGMYQQNNVPL